MLKLIKPGERKGNRYYIIRGRFQGVDIEKTTETTDKGVAERIKSEIEQRILSSGVPGPNARVTFHRAIDLYESSRSLHANDIAALKRLKTAIEDKPLAQIVQADLDTAARALHPDASNEWRNRSVYTPAIAVMNYAAMNEWCAFKRWTRPKMKEPETRAASDSAARALLRATTGNQHLLILWLFAHGTRISNALQVEWDRIDLERETYEIRVAKSHHWQTFPLDSDVARVLRTIPQDQRTGPLFPWQNRWQVYDWLRPLVQSLKIEFTPHMARHWLGKKLDETGMGLRAIAVALGQRSEKSTKRYVSPDLEHIRAKLGEVSGKRKIIETIQ
jgi:integrase